MLCLLFVTPSELLVQKLINEGPKIPWRDSHLLTQKLHLICMVCFRSKKLVASCYILTTHASYYFFPSLVFRPAFSSLLLLIFGKVTLHFSTQVTVQYQGIAQSDPTEADKIRPKFAITNDQAVNTAPPSAVLNPNNVLRTQEDVERQIQANEDSNSLLSSSVSLEVQLTLMDEKLRTSHVLL